MSYKDEIEEKLMEIGIKINKEERTAIRPQIVKLLETLIEKTKESNSTGIKDVRVSKTQKMILDKLRETGEIRFTDLAGKLPIKKPHLSNELRKLDFLGLVFRREINRKLVYYSIK